MSVDVSVEAVIARPLAEVWRYTTEVGNDPIWTGGLVEARPLTPGPLRAGSRVERVSRFLGRRMTYVIEVTAVEESRALHMRTASGPFPMVVRYEYGEADGGTIFRIRASGDPGGFFALAAPLVARAVRRQIAADLATLKDVLEGGG